MELAGLGNIIFIIFSVLYLLSIPLWVLQALRFVTDLTERYINNGILDMWLSVFGLMVIFLVPIFLCFMTLYLIF